MAAISVIIGIFVITTLYFGVKGLVTNDGYQLIDARIYACSVEVEPVTSGRPTDILFCTIDYAISNNTYNTLRFYTTVNDRTSPHDRATKVWWNDQTNEICIIDYPDAHIGNAQTPTYTCHYQPYMHVIQFSSAGAGIIVIAVMWYAWGYHPIKSPTTEFEMQKLVPKVSDIY